MLRIGSKLKRHFAESVTKGQNAVKVVLENSKLTEGDIRNWKDNKSIQEKYEYVKEWDIMEMWENLMGSVRSTVHDDQGWETTKKLIQTIEYKKSCSIPLQEFEVRVNDFFLLTAAKLYTTMMAIYQLTPAIYPSLFSTFPCSYKTYQHQIPSEAPELEYTPEGEEYHRSKLVDRWCQTKALKYGKIISLTRETLMSDRTGQVVEQCMGLGSSAKYKEDQLAALAFADSSNSAHVPDVAEQDAGSYFPENTRCALYRTTAGSTKTDYEFSINKVAQNLKSWSNVEAALKLLLAMTNKNGQYIDVMSGGLTIVVPTALVSRATLLANSIHSDIVGNSTAGTEFNITRVPEPFKNLMPQGSSVKIIVWRLLTSAATAIQSVWYLAGDAQKQFRKHECWGVEFSKASPAQLGQDDFNKDIIAKFKAGFYAGFRAIDDKYVISNPNS